MPIVIRLIRQLQQTSGSRTNSNPCCQLVNQEVLFVLSTDGGKAPPPPAFVFGCLYRPTFWRIFKARDVEEFKPDPYLATLLNCALWVFYGIPIVHPNSILVVTINGIGLVIEAIYLTIWFIYSDCKKRGKVIKTKSVEYMPFLLSLVNFLNGSCWTAYALIRFDLHVTVSVNELHLLMLEQNLVEFLGSSLDDANADPQRPWRLVRPGTADPLRLLLQVPKTKEGEKDDKKNVEMPPVPSNVDGNISISIER